jgi:hypothetical protein
VVVLEIQKVMHHYMVKSRIQPGMGIEDSHPLNNLERPES